MNRVTVEQITRDEEEVQFEPEESYLLSYPEFVAYFAKLEEITRHNLIIAANFVYGCTGSAGNGESPLPNKTLERAWFRHPDL